MVDCEVWGKILVIIDILEKFNIVYDLLMNNGRYEFIYIRGRGINDNYLKNLKYLSFNFFFIFLNWIFCLKKVVYGVKFIFFVGVCFLFLFILDWNIIWWINSMSGWMGFLLCGLIGILMNFLVWRYVIVLDLIWIWICNIVLLKGLLMY